MLNRIDASSTSPPCRRQHEVSIDSRSCTSGNLRVRSMRRASPASSGILAHRFPQVVRVPSARKVFLRFEARSRACCPKKGPFPVAPHCVHFV